MTEIYCGIFWCDWRKLGNCQDTQIAEFNLPAPKGHLTDLSLWAFLFDHRPWDKSPDLSVMDQKQILWIWQGNQVLTVSGTVLTYIFRFRHCPHIHLQTLPLLLRISRVLWYIFSLFRKAHTWLMLKTLHEFHKLPSIFTIKVFYYPKIDDFDDGKCSKTEPTFCKKWFVPPVHLRPFQGSCTLLLGQLQQAGWKNSPRNLVPKSDPHSVRMPCPCWIWAIVASWSWGNFHRAGGKIWRVENAFFWDIWSLKTPPMLKKSDGFGERGDEKQMESSLNWSEMLGFLLHSTDSSSPLYSSF